MKKLFDFALASGPLRSVHLDDLHRHGDGRGRCGSAAEGTGAHAGSFTPPVSLLKPVHGAEAGLETHLATFFDQDYPEYEILFCARHMDDPGLAAARHVAARYPHVPVQFLASGEPTVPNAKLLSLELMAERARHEILIISDSDVRVRAQLCARCGCAIRGHAVWERSPASIAATLRRADVWSRIEAAAMSIEMSAGVLVAEMLEGMKFALGPTMAIRRECLKEIGGFLPMGEYCSDDFLLGNQVAARGHTVVLSDHVIDHVVLHESFWPSMQHQARWMKSTRFSRPKGHLGTALTFSVPFGVLAAIAAWPAAQPGHCGGRTAVERRQPHAAGRHCQSARDLRDIVLAKRAAVSRPRSAGHLFLDRQL